MQKWSLEYFKEHFGQELVTVNDRAPARHADSASEASGTQRTIILPLTDYIDYMQVRCSSTSRVSNM